MIDKINFFLVKLNKIDAVYDSLNDGIGMCPESKLSEALYVMVDPMIDYLEKEIGDAHGSVNWFVWENDKGKKEMEAKSQNWKKMRPIKTVEDLVDLITDTNLDI